jgi:hypothetical protein
MTMNVRLMTSEALEEAVRQHLAIEEWGGTLSVAQRDYLAACLRELAKRWGVQFDRRQQQLPLEMGIKGGEGEADNPPGRLPRFREGAQHDWIAEEVSRA